MIDGILELDALAESFDSDMESIYRDGLKVRHEILKFKFDLNPNDCCVYVRQKKNGLYIGSAHNLAKRYQKFETIDSIIKVINYGPNLTREQLRIKEQETIDEYKKNGYTITNKNKAYRRSH